jgi:AcrR family transcriptional regulator
MPKPFSEQEKQIIQQRLLIKGHELFGKYGLKKVNVEELAKAANISKGAFYQFFESKEALFMDVVEEVEKKYRVRLLEEIDLPGSSPHTRFRSILEKSLSLWQEIPLLQFFASSDYDLLLRRIPPDRLQTHFASDQLFIEQFVAHCLEAGIPLKVNAGRFMNLLYTLLLVVMHRDDFGEGVLDETFDLMLDMITAYCLGEIPSLPV